MQNKNKTIYNLTADEVLAKFSSCKDGLSEEEAKKRLKEYGPNQLREKRNWKWIKLISNQFNDALVWILLVAALLSSFFREWQDVTIILVIVFINALMGFVQEFKAEKILDQIKKLTTTKALVMRDGEKKEIDTKFLVVGDVVFLTSGDNVPADGYILESFDLRVNSFIFTGESKPETKFSKVLEGEMALADISNMVFMGETIATGDATFIITATGMQTELGHIANLAAEVREDPTPLQKQIRSLGKNVAVISIVIGVLVMIAGQYFKMSLYDNFLFALALAVSVVPNGLPAAISVALSLGMRRLLKDSVLAKKLNAVETLGSVSIICTDKTGTITKNELTVTKIVLHDKIISVTGIGYVPEGEFENDGHLIAPEKINNLGLLCKIGTLCNDASLAEQEGKYRILGDPTEGALIVVGKKFNRQEKYFELGEKKINENPFSSERMRMSVIYKNSDTISYVKGSPDVLLDLCTELQTEDGIIKFTDEEKEKVRAIYNSMSSEALRVLAFAYRNLNAVQEKKYLDEAEKNLTWVGLMAMIDPPRKDVGNAISECRKLGIKVVMITGDYEITAQAIAKEVNLIDGSGAYEVINGKTLDQMGDLEVYNKIRDKEIVFARIAPEQKLRIASILKKYKETIAMTGDGVNDAPALKKADIGVAMGVIGTDVSKEAADMILLDDNFASIVKGVEEGRTIFRNFKKIIYYVFAANAGELLTVIFGVLLQIPAPIAAIQILAIDLGTDVFPTFALGLELPEPDVMERGDDAGKKESLLGLKGFRRILYVGTIMATGAVVAFVWSMLRGGWKFGLPIDSGSWLYIKSTTASYVVLSISQMANLLQARSEKYSPLTIGFFKNKYVIGAIFISIGILLSFMHVPILQKYLHMAPIDWKDWLVVIITSLAVFLFEEARKTEEK